MTRATRLSMPHPLADLKLLADSVFDVAIPAASQLLSFNFAVLDSDLFALECKYDPSEPWPVDTVAIELGAWRGALSVQRLSMAIVQVGWCFEQCAAAFRDGHLGYGIAAQAQLIASGAAHG